MRNRYSIVKELQKQAEFLKTEWKNITRQEKLELKRQLEYALSLGLRPKVANEHRRVLSLLKGI